MSIKDRSPVFASLPSQVAALVPEGSRKDRNWVAKEYGLNAGVGASQQQRGANADLLQDERRMARFAQYAMVASEEALTDAGWSPQKEEDLEATVWPSLHEHRHILICM